MSYFVTGGTGFLGRFLIGNLLKRKGTIHVLVRKDSLKKFDALAKKTDGFSGADLKAVIDVAVEAKLREAMRAGGLQPLSGRDILEAIKQHKPTVRDWFQTARNHALYANQSGLYDNILAYMKISK